MKILYLSYTLPKPSSPRRGVFLLRRIEELINQNIKLAVVTTEHIFNLLKFKKLYNFKDLGYNVNQEVTTLIKIENPSNYTNLLFNSNVSIIYKFFKKNNCKLIHAHFIRDGLLALKLKKKFKIPYIVTSHGFDIRNLNKSNKILIQKSIAVLENADKAIFVSQALLNSALLKGYSGNNSVVINNGYNPDIFKYSQNNIITTDMKIGFCGRLDINKRADKLPIIFKHIKNELPLSKLTIMGDGPLKDKIIKDFDDMGLLSFVCFTGSISQEKIADYLNNTDVFILPSVREGFPTVVAEAIGCGVQVVASDADGTPEAVGNAGYVVNQNEPDFEKRFAEKVIFALNNPIPKEIILERSRELTWENIVKKEIEIYREVLENY